MRRWIGLSLLGLLLGTAPAPRSQTPSNTLLLLHARMLDGAGNPWRWADVAVAGDRISFVGDAARAGIQAQRTLDLKGLYLAPGFIDLHTHTAAGLSRASERENLNYLMQGVTTVATGNDGSSPWPIGARLAQWRRDGIGTNAALFVGFGTVRERVLGRADRAPTAEELQREEALVAQGMREGAIGISTGLFYVPQSFSKTDEVIALAQVAARAGGIYDTHLRDESSYTVGLKAAVAEAIEIGRQAHLPIMISHIKALGADVWGDAPAIVQMVDQARAEGIDVVANQYPYLASLTSFEAAVVPNWAEAGGQKQFLARVQDPATHARLLREIPLLIAKRGGPESLVLVHDAADRSLEGKSLWALAAQWKLTPAEAVLRLCSAGSTGVVSHNMKESDLETFMRQDWVATASDGESALPDTLTHPRSFGNEAVKLQQFVVAQHTISLPFAIRAATSLPAAIAGFQRRGLIAPGYYADLVVFDLTQVSSPATYAHPGQYARGFEDVLVNGQFAVEDGELTHRLAGQVLLGPQALAASPAPTSN